jgi:hypothetical protein
MHTEEEKLEIGCKELDMLRGMFRAWLKSDFNWAVEIVTTKGTTGEDDEWDFLLDDWREKFTDWLGPYLLRIRDTKYATEKEIGAFGAEMFGNMKIMLEAIYALTGDVNNEQSV